MTRSELVSTLTLAAPWELLKRSLLRSLRLRHHRGLVHTIPYGEIPKLTNFSRDWVIMKLRFKVPFESDVNKIKKIFKQIGADLLADPELGQDFLQPFKSQGVAEVDDNGIVVRGKFMAKPGRQFMIRKEVYVRVQKAFEEAGIPFARKQVMVHIPGLDNASELGPDDVKAIGAAAADNADEPDKPGPRVARQLECQLLEIDVRVARLKCLSTCEDIVGDFLRHHQRGEICVRTWHDWKKRRITDS